MSNLFIKNHSLTHFTLKSKPIMETYLSQIDQELSDYSFASNYIWLSSSTGFYSIINDTFCFFIMTSGTLTMLLPPLGHKDKTYDAIIECFDIMNEHNEDKKYSKIEYVHENILEGFVNYLEEGTQIYEQLKDFIIEKKLVDYIYSANDLIELKGNSYKVKRNEINKFLNIYPNNKFEILDIEKDGEDVLNLFNKWVKDRTSHMPKEDADYFLDGIFYERFALKRLLENYNNLDLIGIVLFIDNEMKGFTIGEKISENTSSVIIEKTDFEILGCAQFIFKEFVKVLKNKYQSEFINVGDDMGFENLKKVKMSYRPKKLIPKYTIYQK